MIQIWFRLTKKFSRKNNKIKDYKLGKTLVLGFKILTAYLKVKV